MIRVLPVTLLIGFGALCLGRPALPPVELPGLLGGAGDPMLGVLFWHLRLPRLLLALGAGAALGLSGAILQSLLRNPLAAPDVIGVTAGASLGAVGVLVLLGGSGLALAAGAGAGAIGLGAAVMTLSRRGGRSEPARLVLVGIGLGLTAFAGVDLLLARAGDATNAAALAWMTGSLNGRGAAESAMVWAALLPLGAVACAARRRLDRLELGDDLAQSLGIAPGPSRTGLAVLAMALAAVAVAAVGPVPFVAFIAGPLARGLPGRHGPAPALAGLIGGTLLVGADLAARAAIPGVLMPAGVMTGLIGAPWLLWTLHRQIEKARI